MITPGPDPDATLQLETDVKPSATPRSHGVQFAPGTIIAGRYRISGLLGSGGMGEVYRADDTKLDQPVALKFLPARLARDPLLLGRLHDEVRLGRQIAHPNVCRIYDIVEWEHAHFVAMEYVDGEDLSRLLRRIGRLPSDKAIDIVRGIAAGLLAAHAKGILHRDLKPANVMLDSRGDARIMDFGLALSASDDQQGEIAGTPAYMAPEQLQGRPATVQSDLYALGLLMYELFTGKRVHAGKTLPDRLRELTSEVPTPSEHLRDLDPAVERVIVRCLSSDPGQRPRSARELIEALPGGDPLAAAMAAGETPSPRVVAAAGAEGSLRRGFAWTLLTSAILLGTAAVLALRWQSLPQLLPFHHSPEVLLDRAQTIATDLGVPLRGKPLKQFNQRPEYLPWLVKRGGARFADAFRKGPGPILFRIEHGVSPAESRVEPLIATAPGRTTIEVDTAGRLSTLLVSPDQAVAPRPLDWNKLLHVAGLSLATLKPTDSDYVPPVPFDARLAWSGTYPGDETPIRVEAAAWHGMPVFFRVTGDWEPENTLPDLPAPARFVFGISVVLIAATSLLAWRNLRLRRGDRPGALRVGMAMSVSAFVCDLFASRYSWSFVDIQSGFEQLGVALAIGLTAYVMYLAIEPYLRRRWPDRLIAWSRVLAGRWSDPMVGRDTLIGVVGGTAYALLAATAPFVSRWTSSGTQEPDVNAINSLIDIPSAIGAIGFTFLSGAAGGFLCMTLLVIATIVLRNRIAAGVVLFLFLLATNFLSGSTTVLNGILSAALTAWVPFRYGLLSTSVMITVFGMLFLFPAIPAPWATSLAAISYATFAALALWAFRTSLGGQSPFGSMLEEP